jgi:hypothetical protein
MAAKRTRSFEGWDYKEAYGYDYGLSKSGAQKKAEWLKAEGCKYRITHSKRYGCYEVWVRCR